MLHLKKLFLIAIVSELIHAWHFFSTHATWNEEHRKHNPRNRSLTYKVVQITRHVHCGLYQSELCSIIRFLNIIQNSTKPWERIQHVAFCSNKCFHCIGLNYWRLILPEKREQSPVHFMLPWHAEMQKHPHLQIQILTWESCQRLEYMQEISCCWKL